VRIENIPYTLSLYEYKVVFNSKQSALLKESGKNWENYLSGGGPTPSNGITCAEIMKFGFKMQPLVND